MGSMIVITEDGKIEKREFFEEADHLEQLQKAVKGYIEPMRSNPILKFFHSEDWYCNEECLCVPDFKVNKIATFIYGYSQIRGDVVIIGKKTDPETGEISSCGIDDIRAKNLIKLLNMAVVEMQCIGLL